MLGNVRLETWLTCLHIKTGRKYKSTIHSRQTVLRDAVWKGGKCLLTFFKAIKEFP